MSIRMDPDADMGLTSAPRAKAEWAVPPKAPRTVLVVMVCFNYDFTHCGHEAQAVSRALRGYPIRAAMHSKRQIAYVVETHMTAPELMTFLKAPLSAGCIERAWVFTPGADVAANTPMDSFTEKVGQAWQSVRRYNARLRLRYLPASVFERSLPMAENAKGRIITRILDDHPLDRW